MSASDFPVPDLECDVIMKGGATSGMVYPKVILRLAKRYRFRSIGGASAGAVAAAITAAAEYGRARGGFDEIEKIPNEMGKSLSSLFEPAEEARGVFRVVSLGGLQGKPVQAFFAALLEAWPGTLGGLAVGIVLGIAGMSLGRRMAVARPWDRPRTHPRRHFRHSHFSQSKRATFSSVSTSGSAWGEVVRPGSSAVSDWLAEMIEVAAGRMVRGAKPPAAPLTFSDLWKAYPVPDAEGRDPRAIDLRVMTTNLSMRRPHVLPDLGDRNFYFREADFRRIVPDWVVDSMIDETKKKVVDGLSYYPFPLPENVPVVVAARMSLSFPFVISAVPLYRFDFPNIEKGGAPSKILFSDGGISSNFPIHFFELNSSPATDLRRCLGRLSRAECDEAERVRWTGEVACRGWKGPMDRHQVDRGSGRLPHVHHQCREGLAGHAPVRASRLPRADCPRPPER